MRCSYGWPLLVGVVALLGLGPREARAEEWYGEQVIISDVTSAGVTSIGIGANKDGVMLLGAAMYVVGAPAIHAAHGDFGRAGISLGMRVGLPVLGAVAGSAAGCHSKRMFDCLIPTGMLLGGMIGILGASVLDAALLSTTHEDVAERKIMFSIGGAF